MIESAPEAGDWIARRSLQTQHADDARSPFEVDYARIVHSSAFRRLQGKTQILALGDDDFYRTRLTHSLEVAQIATGVIQQLRFRDQIDPAILPPETLVATLGLAHDLGHPPFGHGGELALNFCMREHGGFEGNGQTLRVAAELESYVAAYGADLTRRCLLGLLKYPVRRTRVHNDDLKPVLRESTSIIRVIDRSKAKPAKAYYDAEQPIVDWILEPLSEQDRTLFGEVSSRSGAHSKSLHKSLDCSIMDVSDDIAYGVHDLEDAIALGLIGERRFLECLPPERCAGLLQAIAARPLSDDGKPPYEALAAALFGSATDRKRAVGRLVHYFLRELMIVQEPRFAEPLLRYRAALPDEPRALLDALQALVVADVIESPRVQRLEFKGQQMVIAVFEALASDPLHLLPTETFAAFETGDQQGGMRAICDYVAAMTDAALLKCYERLYSPRMGSVFDPL